MNQEERQAHSGAELEWPQQRHQTPIATNGPHEEATHAHRPSAPNVKRPGGRGLGGEAGRRGVEGE
eukprot:11981681-Alexandrium_andersonii.AAC.1